MWTLNSILRDPSAGCELFAQAVACVGNCLRRFAAPVLVGAVALTACANERPAEPAEYLRLPEFVVGEQPIRVLADDGTAQREFVNIHVRRLPDGELAVADVAASTIRVYARDGALPRTIARGGSGPGELPSAFSIDIQNDTIVAFGIPPMSRPDILVYSAADGFQRMIAATVQGQPRMSVLGRLSDQAYLVKRGMRGMVLNDVPKLGIVIADSATFGVFTPPLMEKPSTVLWFPKVVAGLNYSFPLTGNKVVPVSIDAFPFGARTIIASSMDIVWAIETGTGSFKTFDERGTLRFTKQSSLQPAAFDAGTLTESRRIELMNAKRTIDTTRISAKYAPEIRPKTAPLFSRALAGSNGEIWLQLFQMTPESDQKFIIVNRDGAEVGRASIPARVDVQEIGDTFVLGLRTQASGAIEIVELPLTRK